MWRLFGSSINRYMVIATVIALTLLHALLKRSNVIVIDF